MVRSPNLMCSPVNLRQKEGQPTTNCNIYSSFTSGLRKHPRITYYKSSRIGGVEECIICINPIWPPSKLTKYNFEDISGYKRCIIAILVFTPSFVMHQESDQHIPKCLRSSLYTTNRKIKHGSKKSRLHIIWLQM